MSHHGRKMVTDSCSSFPDGVMIGVVISRIREIRSGEEDDLSKY